MTYGAQIWGVQSNGQQLPQSQIKPLEGIQNKCLRQIAGAYKRTPIAALERETDIPPLNLYLDTQAQQRALKISEDPIEQSTQALLQSIWQDGAPAHRHRRRPRQAIPTRPKTAQELLQQRAQERVLKIRQQLAALQLPETTQRTRQRPQQPLPPAKVLNKGLNMDWKAEWERAAQERQQQPHQRP
jgi:hypothetical protein